MTFEFSEKANQIKEGIFAVLNTKKNEMEAQGKKTYNLSVGTPDFEPAPHIVEAVSEAAKEPKNYKYALTELPELIEAMQNFYRRRFDVELAADEIMSLYGSQEGMAHLAWALCNPGDLVLVPNPGYQIFRIGPQLCDAKVWQYPLLEENNFLPVLSEIPEDVAKQAKYMVVSYPANPICRTAPESFYRELIAFAKKYNIIILHDNAYSDIVYGRAVPSCSMRGQRKSALNFIHFPSHSTIQVHVCPLQLETGRLFRNSVRCAHSLITVLFFRYSMALWLH